jgi:hypothetical protein
MTSRPGCVCRQSPETGDPPKTGGIKKARAKLAVGEKGGCAAAVAEKRRVGGREGEGKA